MAGAPISPPPRTEALLAYSILRRGPWKLIAGSGTDNQTWDQGMLLWYIKPTAGNDPYHQNLNLDFDAPWNN
jgi:hypothetical protein